MTIPIRVLIVDDEEAFAKILERRLSLRGFVVMVAHSGEEALRIAWNNEIDLAVLDLRLTDMDGAEVLERLKAHHPFTEVVILTGFASVESAMLCAKSGSFQYLEKPCQIEDLLRALKDAYRARVRNMFRLYQDKVDELVRATAQEPSLDVLKRLKDLEVRLTTSGGVRPQSSLLEA